MENEYNGRVNLERYSTRGARDVRFVPLDWSHPRDAEGKYIPLRRRDPEDRGESDGLMRDFSDVPNNRIGICAYNSTENVPISPVFQDTIEGRLGLLNYCSRNATVWSTDRADGETWAGILFTNRPYIQDVETRRIKFVDEQDIINLYYGKQ